MAGHFSLPGELSNAVVIRIKQADGHRLTGIVEDAQVVVNRVHRKHIVVQWIYYYFIVNIFVSLYCWAYYYLLVMPYLHTNRVFRFRYPIH